MEEATGGTDPGSWVRGYFMPRPLCCVQANGTQSWAGVEMGAAAQTEGRAAARVKVKSCLSQTFLGLYNECPCLPDLTCIFPKNMKTFKITYGLCKKIVVKKKLTKRGFF